MWTRAFPLKSILRHYDYDQLAGAQRSPNNYWSKKILRSGNKNKSKFVSIIFMSENLLNPLKTLQVIDHYPVVRRGWVALPVRVEQSFVNGTPF